MSYNIHVSSIQNPDKLSLKIYVHIDSWIMLLSNSLIRIVHTTDQH